MSKTNYGRDFEDFENDYEKFVNSYYIELVARNAETDERLSFVSIPFSKLFAIINTEDENDQHFEEQKFKELFLESCIPEIAKFIN